MAMAMDGGSWVSANVKGPMRIKLGGGCFVDECLLVLMHHQQNQGYGDDELTKQARINGAPCKNVIRDSSMPKS
jgi:hypothetical protein